MYRWIVAITGLLIASDAPAAFDVFLEYPGTPRDTQDADHVGEIEVMSVSIAGFRVADIGNASGASTPNLGELVITKTADSATPELFIASLAGAPAGGDAILRFDEATSCHRLHPSWS